MLASILLGSYRRRALGLLLLHPEQSYYVREIARQTGTSVGTLHKELAKLAQAGLLLRKEIVRLMEEYGFDFLRPVGLLPDPQTGEIIQMDALFRRSA